MTSMTAGFMPAFGIVNHIKEIQRLDE